MLDSQLTRLDPIPAPTRLQPRATHRQSYGLTPRIELKFRRRIRSYVPAPSTENTMPSAAKCDSAGSGTKTSPVAQLLPGKRPSKYPQRAPAHFQCGKTNNHHENMLPLFPA